MKILCIIYDTLDRFYTIFQQFFTTVEKTIEKNDIFKVGTLRKQFLIYRRVEHNNNFGRNVLADTLPIWYLHMVIEKREEKSNII